MNKELFNSLHNYVNVDLQIFIFELQSIVYLFIFCSSCSSFDNWVLLLRGLLYHFNMSL